MMQLAVSRTGPPARASRELNYRPARRTEGSLGIGSPSLAFLQPEGLEPPHIHVAHARSHEMTEVREIVRNGLSTLVCKTEPLAVGRTGGFGATGMVLKAG
jgi:hypothetical protein